MSATKEKRAVTPRPKSPRRLHPRHQQFVDEYLVDFNATQAAIRAGYKADNADASAYLLLRRPDVAAALEPALSQRKERMQITAERVLIEYARLAFADMRRVADWGPSGMELLPKEKLSDIDAAAIKEISPTANKGKGNVKLYDKKAALDALARHLGLFDPNRSFGEDRTIGGRDSRTVLRERIERMIPQLMKKINDS